MLVNVNGSPFSISFQKYNYCQWLTIWRTIQDKNNLVEEINSFFFFCYFCFCFVGRKHWEWPLGHNNTLWRSKIVLLIKFVSNKNYLNVIMQGFNVIHAVLLKIQLKPLNVITDNVIIWLIWSNWPRVFSVPYNCLLSNFYQEEITYC